MRSKEIKQTLRECYEARAPKPFILGQPGCGKTQTVYQTFPDVPVYVFQAMLYDPVEIKGLPVYVKGPDNNGKAKFVQFEDIPTGEEGVFFIDDLPHAPAQTQNAFMRLALEGRAGATDIGNLFVICAGNRSIDRAGAKDLQTALANRFMFLNFTIDYEDWRAWAIQNDIAPEIIAYLGTPYGKDWLGDNFVAAEQINPTPRSWEFASDIFKRIVGEKYDEKRIGSRHREAITGCIGVPATAKFLGWLKVYSKLPDLNKIVKGENIYPEDMDIMYAVASGLTAIAKAYEGKRVGIYQRLIDYIVDIPDNFMEIGAWLSKDLCQLDAKTLESNELKLDAWSEKYGEVMI